MPRWVGVPMGRSRALLCLALLAESDSTACGPSGATHREVSFPNCPLAIGIVDHQLPNETTVQPWCLTFFLATVHGPWLKHAMSAHGCKEYIFNLALPSSTAKSTNIWDWQVVALTTSGSSVSSSQISMVGYYMVLWPLRKPWFILRLGHV